MPSFICKVMTPQGQIIKVKLIEEDKISCLKKLKRNGMTPIEIKKALLVPPNVSRKISASISAKKREEITIKLGPEVINSINIKDLKKFTKEFLFLVQAKFSNAHALKTIISNTKNEHFKKILIDLLKETEKGVYIYETMEKYNQVFPQVYVNLIKNGELTELLEEGLKNALAYLENEEKLQNIMQEKVFPNILVIFTTVLLMFLSIVIGIPLIQDLLFNVGLVFDLPLITKYIFNLCNLIISFWYVILVLLVVISVVVYLKFRKTEEKHRIDKFKYKNKLCGKLLYLLDFSKFLRCLSVNAQNKIRIQDSLEVCKSVITNTYMLDTIEKSITGIFKGRSWVDAFEDDKVLNTIVIETLKKNSELKQKEIMDNTIEYVEGKIDTEVEKLIQKITEISYIILGILLLIYVGLILIPSISVYLSSFLLF